jgi:hypothetical protein
MTRESVRLDRRRTGQAGRAFFVHSVKGNTRRNHGVKPRSDTTVRPGVEIITPHLMIVLFT